MCGFILVVAVAVACHVVVLCYVLHKIVIKVYKINQVKCLSLFTDVVTAVGYEPTPPK